MAKIAFTVADGGIKFTENGVKKGSSRAFSFNIDKAQVCTPTGVPVYQVRVDNWEGHSVNGTDTTDYHDFQDKLLAAGLEL